MVTRTSDVDAFAHLPLREVFDRLASSPVGLTSDVARERVVKDAKPLPNWFRGLTLFAAQLKSPITLILIGASLLALSLGATSDSLIILAIVFGGACLSFWQEFRAAGALSELLALVKTRVTVLRDGGAHELYVAEVVPGDVIEFAAGSLVPGDCRLVSAKDLFVDESALTGETYPVEKHADNADETVNTKQDRMLFHGTHVTSGSARAVVIATGAHTELGLIRSHLQQRAPETEFERGIRLFGRFLLELTLFLVLGILAIHLAMGHPAMESLMFSLALAVGFTPQLLPAVVAVNLAYGAHSLAKRQVIVRRLNAIENLGSMNILCADKTGTLTLGEVHIKDAVDFRGVASDEILKLAWINATFETGFPNPIDESLRANCRFERGGIEKLDEIPYDFMRKRQSILVRDGEQRLLIVKGALATILEVCSQARSATGSSIPIQDATAEIQQRFAQFSAEGYRVLAVASHEVSSDRVSRADESELCFRGFLVLEDPPKPGVAETIAELRDLGVQLKIITGDNRLVAATIAARVGLDGENVVTGEELRSLTTQALMRRALEVAVFAEIEPSLKERIVAALRKSGQVVGYLGDGINDAAALHAADVGISVDQCVDVAREAADIVLLKKDLEVVVDGVRSGRETFANTLKYIFLATSANFGNMFSMAGASLFLPFLPLLPKQVLLTNLMTDLPEMTIAGDRVDEEMKQRPQRWNLHDIQRFMFVFGLLSSVFDYATFGVLLFVLQAGEKEFRTGWFVESITSACAIVLVIRTRMPFWRSRPTALLTTVTAWVVFATIAVTYSPLAGPLGFTPLPFGFLAALAGIVAAYVASAEVAKIFYYRRTATNAR